MKTKPEVTPWIPCTTPPIRKGYYDCKYGDGIIRRWYWNGKVWTLDFICQAPTKFGNLVRDIEQEKWRGLKEEVK